MRVVRSLCAARRLERPSFSNAEAGVGVVEVMVAVVLLAVGFLAITGMQMGSLRFTAHVGAASAAQSLAVDIIDRMRGNPAGVSAGHYDSKSTSAGHTAVSCAGASGCDAATLARHDLYRWSSRLHNLDDVSDFRPSLPSAEDGTSASGTVTRLDQGLYRVAVRWYEGVAGERALQMDFGP